MRLDSRYSTESNCWRTQCRWCFLFMIRHCMIVLLYMHIYPVRAYTGATLCKHRDHQGNGLTQTKPIAHMLQLPLSELPVAKPAASAKFRVATELGTCCFQSSIILAGLFERNAFGNRLALSFLDKYLFSFSFSLSLSLWFYSFTLLNGVLKSLPRHKLFTTAQPTKARKQINIRAGNGQLLPRTEWSDLSRYILRLFQYLSTSFRCVSKMQSSCWRGHTNHTTWRKTDPQSCSACQSLLFYLRSTFAR